MVEPEQSLFDQAAAWIEAADTLLITAGAGLTAAAGIDYSDTALFTRHFPAMAHYGFRAQYQLIGAPLEPDLLWGYWAAHVNLVRYQWPLTTPYRHALEISSSFPDEATFVLTSNVDAMFERNGFNPERVHTPQGDYALMQCARACTRNVWIWKSELDAILAATDPITQRVTDPDLIPRCLYCGGDSFLNVRIDNTFIDDHYQPTARALDSWLHDRQHTNGLVLEIGAGFNTPSVIRWPSETLVEQLTNWRLIRINTTHAQTPATIAERSIEIRADATTALPRLA